MRRRHLLVLVVCMSFATLAAADIGQPSSFSVSISRAPGTINADLQVTTQGAVNRASTDAIGFGFFLFQGGGFPPTFVAPPETTTVQRGLPTSNARFAASFSIAVPDEHMAFKYLVFANPEGVTGEGGDMPPSYSQVVSFYYSLQPDLDLLMQPTPPPPGPPQWLWAKGQQESGVNIPALSLWGLVGLGALIAIAGAFLMRRT